MHDLVAHFLEMIAPAIILLLMGLTALVVLFCCDRDDCGVLS